MMRFQGNVTFFRGRRKEEGSFSRKEEGGGRKEYRLCGGMGAGETLSQNCVLEVEIAGSPSAYIGSAKWDI